MKYENCGKCRHEFGLEDKYVSIIKGNMVDLENDLRGQTSFVFKKAAPHKKYAPVEGNTLVIPANACNKERVVDLTKVHLPACRLYIKRDRHSLHRSCQPVLRLL